MIDSVRQFYPDITIVVADDNEHPQPVTGPHIEHYIMPYKKARPVCTCTLSRNNVVKQVSFFSSLL